MKIPDSTIVQLIVPQKDKKIFVPTFNSVEALGNSESKSLLLNKQRLCIKNWFNSLYIDLPILLIPTSFKKVRFYAFITIRVRVWWKMNSQLLPFVCAQ